MVKDARFTYARRQTYRTRSNRLAATKTPGGRVIGRIILKKGSRAKCGDCDVALHGIPAVRPQKLRSMTKGEKSVTRAYGGAVCHTCVRNRIVRAFLEEERKAVKRVLAVKAKAAAA